MRDLNALLLSPGWFRGGTRAKEIHVILEREQEEEHRHAVISNVSTRSQPGAGLKQDSLVHIKELVVALVSFTSCSSWTHTQQSPKRSPSVRKQWLQEIDMQQFECSLTDLALRGSIVFISYILCVLWSGRGHIFSPLQICSHILPSLTLKRIV